MAGGRAVISLPLSVFRSVWFIMSYLAHLFAFNGKSDIQMWCRCNAVLPNLSISMCSVRCLMNPLELKWVHPPEVLLVLKRSFHLFVFFRDFDLVVRNRFMRCDNGSVFIQTFCCVRCHSLRLTAVLTCNWVRLAEREKEFDYCRIHQHYYARNAVGITRKSLKETIALFLAQT